VAVQRIRHSRDANRAAALQKTPPVNALDAYRYEARAMKLDRASVMRDAHRRFRDGKRLGLGWTFGQCLSTSWQAAKMARDSGSMKYARAA